MGSLIDFVERRVTRMPDAREQYAYQAWAHLQAVHQRYVIHQARKYLRLQADQSQSNPTDESIGDG